MLGILREVTEHALKIRPCSKLVKQRLRHFDEEKNRAIGEETVKLLVDGFIKEVYHPEWLVNPILLRKRVGNGECVLIHGSQQSMSKGSISLAMHRLSSRLDPRVRNPLLP